MKSSWVDVDVDNKTWSQLQRMPILTGPGTTEHSNYESRMETVTPLNSIDMKKDLVARLDCNPRDNRWIYDRKALVSHGPFDYAMKLVHQEWHSRSSGARGSGGNQHSHASSSYQISADCYRKNNSDDERRKESTHISHTRGKNRYECEISTNKSIETNERSNGVGGDFAFCKRFFNKNLPNHASDRVNPGLEGLTYASTRLDRDDELTDEVGVESYSSVYELSLKCDSSVISELTDCMDELHLGTRKRQSKRERKQQSSFYKDLKEVYRRKSPSPDPTCVTQPISNYKEESFEDDKLNTNEEDSEYGDDCLEEIEVEVLDVSATMDALSRGDFLSLVCPLCDTIQKVSKNAELVLCGNCEAVVSIER